MTNSFLRIPWEHIIASCPIAIVYDRCGIQSHITCEIKQINIHSLLLPLNNGVPVESSYHEYITPTPVQKTQPNRDMIGFSIILAQNQHQHLLKDHLCFILLERHLKSSSHADIFISAMESTQNGPCEISINVWAPPPAGCNGKSIYLKRLRCDASPAYEIL